MARAQGQASQEPRQRSARLWELEARRAEELLRSLPSARKPAAWELLKRLGLERKPDSGWTIGRELLRLDRPTLLALEWAIERLADTGELPALMGDSDEAA